MDKLLLNRCRSWMLRAENLAVIRECRRLVQQEFGVTLHIHDDELLEKICAYGARSRERKLQRLALPIERLLLYGLVSDEFPDIDLSQLPLPAKSALLH
jgi:hypothetical protein